MTKRLFRLRLYARARFLELVARRRSGEEREALETLAENLDRVREAA